MPTSREAAVDDLYYGGIGLNVPGTWILSPLTAANPLAFAKWDARHCCWQSSNPAVTRDDFVAQAMLMLVDTREKQGWSRKRAVQELSIWGGPQPKATLPNLWAERIKESKEAKLLGREGKKLNHEDNFWAFNHLYSDNVFLVQKDVTVWSRIGSSNAELHWLAEESCVQWAKAQSAELQDAGCRLLANRNLMLQSPSVAQHDGQTAPVAQHDGQTELEDVEEVKQEVKLEVKHEQAQNPITAAEAPKKRQARTETTFAPMRREGRAQRQKTAKVAPITLDDFPIGSVVFTPREDFEAGGSWCTVVAHKEGQLEVGVPDEPRQLLSLRLLQKRCDQGFSIRKAE